MRAVEATLDELVRRRQCAPEAQLALCTLRLAADRLAGLLGEAHATKRRFCQEASALFAAAETTYCQIYVAVYRVLDPAPRDTPFEAQGVPIDPTCALNVVLPAPVVTICSDNEALLKLPESAFATRTGAAQAAECATQLFEAHCERMATLEAACEALENAAVPAAVECVTAALCALHELVRDSLLVIDDEDDVHLAAFRCALKQMRAEQDEALANEREERTNCHDWLANARAKSLVVAQLYDNLLRTYWRTTTQRRNARVVSIF